jgi:hypothetical protein
VSKTDAALVVLGLFCFGFRLAELRNTVREYANGLNKFGYLLLGITAFLFVFKLAFGTIDEDDVVKLLPIWGGLQIYLCAYASGIDRAKRTW